jgi:hypothetical protein
VIVSVFETITVALVPPNASEPPLPAAIVPVAAYERMLSVMGASSVIVAGAVKEEPIVATEAEEFGTPADQFAPIVHDPPVDGVHIDDSAVGATIPRTVNSMLWVVAPGTFSSDRFKE